MAKKDDFSFDFGYNALPNLRTNGNIEQFALFNDAALHDWHAAWIDAKHHQRESDPSRDSPAG